tara:strand:+ start:1869 stop:2498 length:630 start_codon:yes stop_codon:yes gene_type:complete
MSSNEIINEECNISEDDNDIIEIRRSRRPRPRSRDDNNSTEYIISQNEKLTKDNQNLIKKNCKLNSKMEDLENELGLEEKKIVHLRGLLKNFKELSDLNEKIAKNSDAISTLSKKEIKIYSDKLNLNTNICSIIGVLWLSILYSYTNIYTVAFVSVYVFISQLCIISLDFSEVNYRKKKSYEKSNELIKDEIKKLVDALDYINEYIDSI